MTRIIVSLLCILLLASQTGCLRGPVGWQRVSLNQRISAGKHVLLTDQYTNFPLSELADGIHPSPAGYTRMAGVWYTAIQGYLR